MQAKWDEMFGVKKDEVVEEVKPKKPRKKIAVKKPTAPKASKSSGKKSTSAKTTAVSKKVVRKPAGPKLVDRKSSSK